ncbi:hypothetical protein [Mycoplasmopsis columbinasalis]|uniref:Uncharacterized protein n=1 Tax=Mycoplasmopsis columbinasalis TaxID=114880 RepID=A0A449BAY9_9BACT|nr:hypothetical protein [Mycoplasmopsis columbinasalis]VEU78368.1 Uncharacterised protein [Mycoplasmopsis columbinasalis]
MHAKLYVSPGKITIHEFYNLQDVGEYLDNEVNVINNQANNITFTAHILKDFRNRAQIFLNLLNIDPIYGKSGEVKNSLKASTDLLRKDLALSDLSQFYSYLREFASEKFSFATLKDNAVAKTALANLLATGDNNAPSVISESVPESGLTYNSIFGLNQVVHGVTNNNFRTYLTNIQTNLNTHNVLEDTTEFDLSLITGSGSISTNTNTKFHWLDVTNDTNFKDLFTFFYGLKKSPQGSAIEWEVNGQKVLGSELNPANTRIKLLVRSKDNVLNWWKYGSSTTPEGTTFENGTNIRTILTKARVEKLIGNQWVISQITPNILIKPHLAHIDLTKLFSNLTSRVTSANTAQVLFDLNNTYDNVNWSSSENQKTYAKYIVQSLYDRLVASEHNEGDQGVYLNKNPDWSKDPYLAYSESSVEVKNAWKTFMPKYHNNFFKLEGERIIQGNYQIGATGKSFSSLYLDYDNQIVKMSPDFSNNELNVVITVPTFFNSLPKYPYAVTNDSLAALAKFPTKPNYVEPWMKYLYDDAANGGRYNTVYAAQNDNLLEALELSNSSWYLPDRIVSDNNLPKEQFLSKLAFLHSPLASDIKYLEAQQKILYLMAKWTQVADGNSNYAMMLIPQIYTDTSEQSNIYRLGSFNTLSYRDSYSYDQVAGTGQWGTALYGAQVFYFNFKFNVNANGQLAAYPKATETYTYLPSGVFQANSISNFEPYKDPASGKYLRSRIIENSGATKVSDYFGVTWKVDSPETKGGFAFDVDDGGKTVTASDFVKFISYNTIVNSNRRFDYKNTNRDAVYATATTWNAFGHQNFYNDVAFKPGVRNQTRRLKLEPTHMKIMHLNNSGNALIYLNALGDGVIYRSTLTVNNPNLISESDLLTSNTSIGSTFGWSKYWNVGNNTPYDGFNSTTEIWVDGDHIFADSVFPANRASFTDQGYYWKWLPYENNTTVVTAAKNSFVKSIKFNTIDY